MREFIRNPKFKSPYFWLSIIALIFSAAGIDFNALTNWNLFFEALLSILNNPVSIVAVLTALIGIYNNNDTKGIDSIKPKQKEIDDDDAGK
jgi:uncharacterized membrane protein